AWAQRMREAAWHEKLAQKGVVGPYLVYAYGIRVDAGAEEAARKGGIGLLKIDGEVLAPVALIEPLAPKNDT
ncbi:MAG: hypothetical protein RML93_00165, partial [Anaerolineales bacterium]|nr:hypothetical protein [Anaerolineales bacterium]MDW8445684.1 hypothetical protein [Anaerolineales bacterium]